MLNRRHFLKQTVGSSSLLALSSLVPEFLVNTARAAEAGKDQVLVVVELTGGNDGLNTVIPYADDLYHKARPKLHYTKNEVVKIDDHVGLHPSLRQLGDMLQKGELAVVQGIGYPNPNRSHFESMDVWQSADPRRRSGTGWIARSAPELQGHSSHIAAVHLGPKELPLALQGAAGGVVSLGTLRSYLSEPNAKDNDAKTWGIQVGHAAATIMLAVRAHDGSDAVIQHPPATKPGDWKPTPPAYLPANTPQWPFVTPSCPR